MQNKKKEKEARENLAKQELEKIQKKRAILYNQTEKGECSTSSIIRKRKEVIPDQAEEKKPEVIKDKGKRRMYEQKTLSEEKENHSKKNNIVKEKESHLRIEESITVWNIPYHISRSQVFFAIRHIGRVKNIEMIKERSEKIRAEISFEEGSSSIQKIEN